MKFMIVVLLAVVLAANAKVITLVDMLKAYEQTDAIGGNAPVAKQALRFMKPLTWCEQAYCYASCIQAGYSGGHCVSPGGEDFCQCE